jgi:DNA-directed RNA polymerase subunit beta
VIQLVKVYMAEKRKVSVGDKMAGRHGNKGIVARIVQEEDMPILPDGRPVDICLNPLGVPSRMNVGQILETHLGWAARHLGFYAKTPVFQGANEREIGFLLRLSALQQIHRTLELSTPAPVVGETEINTLLADIMPSAADQDKVVLFDDAKFSELTGKGISAGTKALVKAVHTFVVAAAKELAARERVELAHQVVVQEQLAADEELTPLVRTAAKAAVKELTAAQKQSDAELLTARGLSALAALVSNSADADIDAALPELLQLGGIATPGKTRLRDGRTGEWFTTPVTVGEIYMLKLSHLVDDKIHARSIGPYSLVTQQPLAGKAQFGGQRFGEMEVWALEAYGAAHTLREMLTVKSDDVTGRSRVYEAIVKGQNLPEPGIPESFNVLVKELQALGIHVTMGSRESGFGFGGEGMEG